MLFASDGARVALVDLPGSAVSEVAESIRALDGEVVAIEADLALPADIERIADESRKAFGPIDIVVHRDGTQIFETTETISCDPRIEAAVATSCTGGNGRFDLM